MNCQSCSGWNFFWCRICTSPPKYFGPKNCYQIIKTQLFWLILLMLQFWEVNCSSFFGHFNKILVIFTSQVRITLQMAIFWGGVFWYSIVRSHFFHHFWSFLSLIIVFCFFLLALKPEGNVVRSNGHHFWEVNFSSFLVIFTTDNPFWL